MAWFTDRHFFLLAVLLYGVSTVYSIFLWRSGFRQADRVNYFILLAQTRCASRPCSSAGSLIARTARSTTSMKRQCSSPGPSSRLISSSACCHAAAVSRRVPGAGDAVHRHLRIDAVTGPAARAEARGVYRRRLAQPTRSTNLAGLRRVRPWRGGGGDVPERRSMT